ncbi:hypothetical protein BJ742DRAFT_836923 [Cladochytrium replicatum]|nr:hypothetical protein BJ742DRAFT_836923 [Cladochytrium replicatum]
MVWSNIGGRQVAITNQQLLDPVIKELPLPKLKKNGFIFIWVITNKYLKASELMERWGYTSVQYQHMFAIMINKNIADTWTILRG